MLNFPGWFPFLHKDKARDAQVSFFLRQMTTRQKKSIGPKELAETIRSHLDLQKETPNAGKPGTSRFFKKISIIFQDNLLEISDFSGLFQDISSLAGISFVTP